MLASEIVKYHALWNNSLEIILVDDGLPVLSDNENYIYHWKFDIFLQKKIKK